jgi:hypothetical protein
MVLSGQTILMSNNLTAGMVYTRRSSRLFLLGSFPFSYVE